MLNKLNNSGGKMPTITLSMPDDLKKQMDEFGDINWSAVAREAIKGKLSQLVLFKSIVSKSRLTEKDALELGRQIKSGRFNELKKRGLI